MDNVTAELNRLQVKEQKWLDRQEKTPKWKESLADKVPDGLQKTLEAAFAKAFALVFAKGSAIIEKTFDKDDLVLSFESGDYIVDKSKSLKSVKRMEKLPQKKSRANNMMTAASGAGLGILGIGLPDIPLLISTVLKGIYEIALSYGCSYETEEEQIYILRLIRTALADDSIRKEYNSQLDSMSTENVLLGQEMDLTAKIMADALLVEKFIQGIPIIGVTGGIVNLSVYRKISKLAMLKYKKRYLQAKLFGVRKADEIVSPETDHCKFGGAKLVRCEETAQALSVWELLLKKIVWKQLDFVHDKTVLDFGSGNGVTADYFAVSNAVTAVEPEMELLNVRSMENEYIQRVGSLEVLKEMEAESFDVILCHNVLEYASDREDIVREFYRLLRKDGCLSIVKHNRAGRVMQMVVLLNQFEHANELLDGGYSAASKYGTIRYYEDEDVIKWCDGFAIEENHGIRTFWDLQQNQEIQKEQEWQEKMLEMELRVTDREEYRAVAFFHHLILKKRGKTEK